MNNIRFVTRVTCLFVCCATAVSLPLSVSAETVPEKQTGMPVETIEKPIDDLILARNYNEARDKLASQKDSISAADFAYWSAKIGLAEANDDHQKEIQAQFGRLMFITYNADDSKAPPKVKVALEAINKAIAAEPKRAEFYLLRSELYNLARLPVHQIGDLTQVISLDPLDPKAYVKRAEVWKVGSQFYAPAELECCTNPDLKASLKKTWRDSRESDATKASDSIVRELALKDYDKAIEVKPEDDAAYFERAEMRRRTGDNKGAIQDSLKVYELTGNNSMFAQTLAELYMKDGQYEKAVDYWTKYLKDFTMDKESFVKRAECYTKLGKVAEADADIKTSKEEWNPAGAKRE